MTTTRNALTITVPDGLPFIESVREFDAPVAAVYRAHVDPDLVKQWLGPDGYEMDIEAYDVRPGGRYRYVHRSPDGGVYAFNGVFHTAVPDSRIVQTFEWEGAPGSISLETVELVDLGDGRTRLLGHSVYPSVEARDAMASSGMETGMSQGYDRLDALLPTS